jgi:hypothetical protein
VYANPAERGLTGTVPTFFEEMKEINLPERLGECVAHFPYSK